MLNFYLVMIGFLFGSITSFCYFRYHTLADWMPIVNQELKRMHNKIDYLCDRSALDGKKT